MNFSDILGNLGVTSIYMKVKQMDKETDIDILVLKTVLNPKPNFQSFY